MLKFLLELLNKLLTTNTKPSKQDKLSCPKHSSDIEAKQPQPKNTKAASTTKKQSEPTRVIVIDPGHGGADPGAVYSPNKNIHVAEKDAALALSLTLKYLLTRKGWKVHLTRTTDTRPAYSYRTNLPAIVDADAFVSIHFNSPNSYGLVYYAGEKNRPISKRLAQIIGKHMGFKRLWSSTQSRFGRLYIDNVRYDIPSVLVEIDSIDKYKNTKAYRLKKAQAIVYALEEFFKNE